MCGFTRRVPLRGRGGQAKHNLRRAPAKQVARHSGGIGVLRLRSLKAAGGLAFVRFIVGPDSIAKPAAAGALDGFVSWKITGSQAMMPGLFMEPFHRVKSR